jgi:hypothetical protein
MTCIANDNVGGARMIWPCNSGDLQRGTAAMQ